MLFYERCAPRPEDAEKKQEPMETLVEQPKFNFELTKELEEVSLFVLNDKACFLKYNSWVKRDQKNTPISVWK
jgi:hypothetical protein